MKRGSIAVVLALLLGVAGCTEKKHFEYAGVDANVSLDTPRREALAERVMEYWDARSRHDFKTSYEMELPYDRYLKEYSLYEAEGRSLFKGFFTQVTKIRIDSGDSRIAWVSRDYRYDDKNLKMRDKWILVNGVWYHKYFFSVFPQTGPLR